jgi:hypothetical protein
MMTLEKNVRLNIKPMCRIKESLLFKTAFTYTTEGGETALCPDKRNRVWKLWSRVMDNLCDLPNGTVRHDEEEFRMLISGLTKTFRNARHFVLPRKADTWNLEVFNNAVRQRRGKVASQAEWMDMIRSMFDTFILPFPVCAVHIPGEAIVMIKKLAEVPIDWTVGGSQIVEQAPVGANGTWGVYVLHPNRSDAGARLVHVTDERMEEGSETVELRSHSCLCVGIVEVAEKDDALDSESPMPFKVASLLRWDLMDSGHVVPCWRHDAPSKHEEVEPTNVIGESAQIAFDLLYKIQSHKRFIVEVSPVAQKKKAKPKQKSSILPISQRPVYLSLEPQEIREQFNIATPEVPGKQRAPHERRAHLRELRSARFTWKQGQVIPVKASWVGTTSGPASEGRQYRVLVENASPHVSG